ncbi:MAG: hypothetical protein L0Y71_26025 [Gemmataceae bacterium]|nr:hypothetical protein [Gemmataceae bacterium]
MNAARSELIRDLKEQLRRWEGVERGGDALVLSTGLPVLDQWLPRGGLAPRSLYEWLAASEGAGAATLTLVLAARLQAHVGALVVIDAEREFYPPAAAHLGIDLDRTVVVQPANARDALWAWEQALRSPAGCLVWGWLQRVDDGASRRLQLAAETGGSLGFLLRPAQCRRQASWGEARFLISPSSGMGKLVGRGSPDPHPSADDSAAPGRRLHLELLHCRGGFGGGAILLELHHEAGHVHLAAQLADPTAARSAARA